MSSGIDFEDQCRSIVRKMKKRKTQSAPETLVVRQLELTLDHVDSVRKRQNDLISQLKERELEIGTQILNLEGRVKGVVNWLDQMRLKNEFSRMLDRATWQAHRLELEHESAIQKLQTRMLELWNMYEQLSIDYGDSKGTE